MGKLEGKVAVITGGSSGMALETAKLFVEEGAYVFITGRRQEVLDEAVKAIGRNVTGVRADSANLVDLDRLYEKVKSEKGHIDIVFASAGGGEVDKPIGLISEQLVDDTPSISRPRYAVHRPKGAAANARWRLDHPQRLERSAQGISWRSVYAAAKAAVRSFARTWPNDLKDRKIRVNSMSPGAIVTPRPAQFLTEESKRTSSNLAGSAGTLGLPKEIAAAVPLSRLGRQSFTTAIDLVVDGGMARLIGAVRRLAHSARQAEHHARRPRRPRERNG